MTQPTPADLFPQSAQAYGPLHQPTLVDQYNRYVESAERVSERRGAANTYLLTVNTALVSLAGLTQAVPAAVQWLPLIPLAGILVCITWLGLLASYRELNAAKFRVIEALEQKLPAAVYTAEWGLMGRNPERAIAPLSVREGGVPMTFIFVYLALAVMAYLR